MHFNNITFNIRAHIKDRIITSEFKPGQRLNETELASSLDISRPPLREAFRMLENERLVVSFPRKGTYVTDVSIEDLERVFEAREMIECCAIKIMGRRDFVDLSSIASSLDSASRLCESPPDTAGSDEIVGYVKAITEYHAKVIECTGNYWLIQFFDSVASHLARYQYISLHMPGRREYVLSEHQEIFELIKKGSFDQAMKNTRDHIRKGSENLKKIIFGDRTSEESQMS